MSSLHALRTQLAATLTWAAQEDTPALTGHAHMPARLAPPVAIVTEGSPYLESGRVFGDWTVRHRVDLVAAAGQNDTMTRQLDTLLAAAVTALEDAGTTVTEAGDFYTLQANGVPYLAVTITTTTTTRDL